jgi:hypothetical protein
MALPGFAPCLTRFLTDAFRQFFAASRTIPPFVDLRLDLPVHQELGELAPLRFRPDAAFPFSPFRHGHLLIGIDSSGR